MQKDELETLNETTEAASKKQAKFLQVKTSLKIGVGGIYLRPGVDDYPREPISKNFCMVPC